MAVTRRWSSGWVRNRSRLCWGNKLRASWMAKQETGFTWKKCCGSGGRRKENILGFPLLEVEYFHPGPDGSTIQTERQQGTNIIPGLTNFTKLNCAARNGTLHSFNFPNVIQRGLIHENEQKAGTCNLQQWLKRTFAVNLAEKKKAQCYQCNAVIQKISEQNKHLITKKIHTGPLMINVTKASLTIRFWHNQQTLTICFLCGE